jgi:hypothetical protein
MIAFSSSLPLLRSFCFRVLVVESTKSAERKLCRTRDQVVGRASRRLTLGIRSLHEKKKKMERFE